MGHIEHDPMTSSGDECLDISYMIPTLSITIDVYLFSLILVGISLGTVEGLVTYMLTRSMRSYKVSGYSLDLVYWSGVILADLFFLVMEIMVGINPIYTVIAVGSMLAPVLLILIFFRGVCMHG